MFRQSAHCRIKVVYHARPAVTLSDSVEGMRVPRSLSYLSVLDERLYNNVSALVCATVYGFITRICQMVLFLSETLPC